MPRIQPEEARALERERSAARIIELFQAQFLTATAAALPQSDYAVKGGVNMRFFFQSPRSSKDMDFDYLGARFEPFADRVRGVFEGRALAELLRLDGIAIVRLTHAKATQTTQRWKLGLTAPGIPDASSKVEFSARRSGQPYELAATDAALAARLRIRPLRVNHYLPEAAVAQKVEALRGRAHTEPRDVFDLDHLLTRYPDALAGAGVRDVALRAATERAAELSYEDYESAVTPYLDEELRPILGTRAAWEDMQVRVIERLERASSGSR